MKLSELCPVELPEGFDLPHEVHIGPEAQAALPDLVEAWLGPRPLIVADPDTAAAADPLPHPGLVLGRHPHADAKTVRDVVERLGDTTGLLAVGSGTINDICKRAAAERGLPYIVNGTAASMNGFASGIAAILSDEGLKTTVVSAPARAIVLDTRVLATAPWSMARAGLGDLLSKPVSDSDWWLADQLEGVGYSDLPSRVVQAAFEEASAAAPGLPDADPEAHGALGRALVLSGVAMVVAGSSAPASGGEHLLSHLIDMEALAAKRDTKLHGAQVGVTTLISAALYQRLLKADASMVVDPPSWAEEEARLRVDFGPLADTVIPQAKAKHARAADRAATLRDKWSEIRDGLEARNIPTAAELRAPLVAAKAPNTLEHLHLPRHYAARIFRLARDIRDRITVLDVAFAMGILPGAIDEILAEAGV